MDDDISHALADLKAVIEQQMVLQQQQQTNELLRTLVSVLQESGQATADPTEALGLMFAPEVPPDRPS
jgi:hypothetical protein